MVLSIAFVLVGLRMAVRIHRKQRHLYVSDGLLVLACVFALGLVTCDTITYRAGYMTTLTAEDAFIGKVSRWNPVMAGPRRGGLRNRRGARRGGDRCG